MQCSISDTEAATDSTTDEAMCADTAHFQCERSVESSSSSKVSGIQSTIVDNS